MHKWDFEYYNFSKKHKCTIFFGVSTKKSVIRKFQKYTLGSDHRKCKSGFCEGRTTARGASTRPMKYLCISSFKMIIDLIKSGYGISFVYEVLAKSDPELGIFTLKGEPIVREFNVIYLKHADVREKMEWFL